MDREKKKEEKEQILSSPYYSLSLFSPVLTFQKKKIKKEKDLCCSINVRQRQPHHPHDRCG